MANYKSSIRRIRRSERSRIRNQQYRSMMKTAVKKVLTAEDRDSAHQSFVETQSLLDKLVSKGIIHKNKAANQKSRLASHVNKL